MEGKELFSMWVHAGLCADREYAWDMLSVEWQHRWNELAKQLCVAPQKPSFNPAAK